jgi:hypothetical protein
MTPDEVAMHLDVPLRDVHRLIDRGILPTRDVGINCRMPVLDRPPDAALRGSAPGRNTEARLSAGPGPTRRSRQVDISSMSHESNHSGINSLHARARGWRSEPHARLIEERPSPRLLFKCQLHVADVAYRDGVSRGRLATARPPRVRA